MMKKALLLMLALTSTIAPLPAAAGVLDELKAGAPLRVCMWPDYFGISYRNPRTGSLQGVDIELSAAFAKELGARLEYVETDFSRVVQEIADRRCHIAMMGVGVTPERAARVAFSRPYLRSDVYAITTRASRIASWEDLDRPGRTIAVQKGTFMEKLMQDRLKSATLMVVARPGERESAVESGRADAFITDYPYSQRMLATADWARRVAPTTPVQLTDYAYALEQGDKPWLDRVNQFVSRIKADGRLEAAAGRNGLAAIVVRD